VYIIFLLLEVREEGGVDISPNPVNHSNPELSKEAL